MKKFPVSFLSLLITFVFVFSCSKVPITGRRQVNLLPESEMISLSLGEYSEFLTETPALPASDSRVVAVRKVGDRIKNAVEKYLSDNKESKRVDGFQWEFNVVNDPTVNAWCMPGGKVVVYTGILPVTETDAGLAVVMGHEIAHAIARHGNERMSQGLIVNAAGQTLGVVLAEKPGLAREIFLQSYGLGSTLGMLSYSRTHETEADKLGLVFMAMAGYDPNTAIGFWQRMSAQGGEAPPEILSTHPSDETRINTLKEFMPTAMQYYKPALNP
ncbi:MAG: M48 family metallopeptidase [Crocinitomicaceae bacterium]|nr:M48 family metallopeptidase [Crocinitomicaceae bacterium]